MLHLLLLFSFPPTPFFLPLLHSLSLSLLLPPRDGESWTTARNSPTNWKIFKKKLTYSPFHAKNNCARDKIGDFHTMPPPLPQIKIPLLLVSLSVFLPAGLSLPPSSFPPPFFSIPLPVFWVAERGGGLESFGHIPCGGCQKSHHGATLKTSLGRKKRVRAACLL